VKCYWAIIGVLDERILAKPIGHGMMDISKYAGYFSDNNWRIVLKTLSCRTLHLSKMLFLIEIWKKKKKKKKKTINCIEIWKNLAKVLVTRLLTGISGDCHYIKACAKKKGRTILATAKIHPEKISTPIPDAKRQITLSIWTIDVYMLQIYFANLKDIR
jgi:hypothetical protein